MTSKWKREDTELFIYAMQQHPCLYNIKSAEYLDRTKKAQAFNEILKDISKSIPNVSVQDLKQKWRTLRTQYTNEQRMMNSSKMSGAGMGDIYVPKLWCFNQLSFLKTNTKLRASGDNVKNHLDDEKNFPEIIIENESLSKETPKKKDKWKREDTKHFIYAMQQHPCIYNTKCAEYLDRTKKAQAFNEILEDISKSIPNVSVQDLKQKWRTLRTQYMQEQRMMKSSKTSGSGMDDIYVPKLWCFNQLSFLITNTQMRASGDNVKNHLDDEENFPESIIKDASLSKEPPKKKDKWKREDTELFIYAMQQHPCLYNIKSAEYLDRTKKAQAFNEILEDISKSIPNVSVEDLKQKWRTLRTQYMYEQRMMKYSKKSGSGMGDIYVPKLWCFNQLSFLRTNTKMRTSGDNVENHLDDEENFPEIKIEDASSSKEPPKKKDKRVRDVNALRNDLLRFRKTMNVRKNDRKFSWLGTLVTNAMDEIDPNDQGDAAWQVQCLMRQLTQKKIKSESHSSCSSSATKELSMDAVFDEDDLDETNYKFEIISS